MAVEQLARLEDEVKHKVGALFDVSASLLADVHAVDVLELLQGVSVIDATTICQDLKMFGYASKLLPRF